MRACTDLSGLPFPSVAVGSLGDDRASAVALSLSLSLSLFCAPGTLVASLCMSSLCWAGSTLAVFREHVLDRPSRARACHFCVGCGPCRCQSPSRRGVRRNAAVRPRPTVARASTPTLSALFARLSGHPGISILHGTPAAPSLSRELSARLAEMSPAQRVECQVAPVDRVRFARHHVERVVVENAAGARGEAEDEASASRQWARSSHRHT